MISTDAEVRLCLLSTNPRICSCSRTVRATEVQPGSAEVRTGSCRAGTHKHKHAEKHISVELALRDRRTDRAVEVGHLSVGQENNNRNI